MSSGSATTVSNGSRAERVRALARSHELPVAWLGLVVLGILVYAPHILHGGFYLDDWSNGAATLRPHGGGGFGEALAYFSKITLYRPILVVYVPLTYVMFGTHMAYHLAWAAMLAILVACVLYGILRTLNMPRRHAWLIAALTLAYPWFDSTRFWETADQATLSILFAGLGVWVALAGLSRPSLRSHCLAALLYLLSILTYEITLPAIAGVGVLYWMRAGWRNARTRWAIDIAVVVGGGLWVGTQTNRESYGFSADLSHFKEIVTSGGTMLGRSIVPVGAQRTTLALVVIGVVLVTGCATLWTRRTRAPEIGEWGLRSWVGLMGGGLVLATLGWAMLVPANPYYTPTIYGVTNRVNALAGFGLVMAVYATLGTVGTLLGDIRPKLRPFGGVVVVLLGVVLGGAYVKVLERHSSIWNDAYHAEAAGIGELKTQFPTLPRDTTVFVSDYPAYETLGVPIFSANWDVNGMIKLQYKDGSLSAYPVIAGLSLDCRVGGVGIEGAGGPSVTAPYGTARLLDVSTGRHSTPRNERECREQARSYTSGPLTLSQAY
jgi:hypothetical protein